MRRGTRLMTVGRTGAEPTTDAASQDESHQLNNRIFFRLFQVANTLQRQATQQLGVTTVQWAVLGALSQARWADGMKMAHLCDYLVVSRQNLDGVLKRLERDGLLERVTDVGDKRSRIVRLTSAGRAHWRDLARSIQSFYAEAASCFDRDERAALAQYLTRLQSSLSAVDLGRPLAQDGSSDNRT